MLAHPPLLVAARKTKLLTERGGHIPDRAGQHLDGGVPRGLDALLRRVLGPFVADNVRWADIAREAAGLSHAEIVGACEDAAKDMVLEGRPALDTLLPTLFASAESLMTRS